MTDKFRDAWASSVGPDHPPVPPRYRGVWRRTLLETPEVRDDTTFVRWMQLGCWHADLRIPAVACAARTALPLSQCSEEQLALLATQQGFCGVTQVSRGETGEVCTWHRVVDYQPPRPAVDAGVMVFESPDCVIETGLDGAYREMWQRLPNSTARLIALAEPARPDGLASARLFMAGQYLMRVRPQCQTGPDFEISFGTIESGRWHIQQSTRPAFEGQIQPFSVERSGNTRATVADDASPVDWDILEWSENQG